MALAARSIGSPVRTASVCQRNLIDGFLYHEADLSSAVHHADRGGVSDHVFALAHLLGFRFAPRIPNLAERRLYAFRPASTWPTLAPFIAGRPATELVAAHWEKVLRLALVTAAIALWNSVCLECH
jgi:TnpA family transposase